MKEYVLGGKRLAHPKFDGVDDRNGDAEECWKYLCTLIDQCWQAEPSDRPKFTGLVTALTESFDSEAEELPPMRDIGALLQKVGV